MISMVRNSIAEILNSLFLFRCTKNNLGPMQKMCSVHHSDGYKTAFQKPAEMKGDFLKRTGIYTEPFTQHEESCRSLSIV